MEAKLEVVTVPVADVDRALAFYTEQCGFALDVDWHPKPEYRVVQVTPPGSSCSVQFGIGLTDAAPGSFGGGYLVVADLELAAKELRARGVEVSEFRHKAPWQTRPGDFDAGLAADRGDYASLADVTDPDGNTWTLQERGYAAGAH
jgi:catechol 2,3-dioxygenase-like lactoylglutathione lyase family enzyme